MIVLFVEVKVKTAHQGCLDVLELMKTVNLYCTVAISGRYFMFDVEQGDVPDPQHE